MVRTRELKSSQNVLPREHCNDMILKFNSTLYSILSGSINPFIVQSWALVNSPQYLTSHCVPFMDYLSPLLSPRVSSRRFPLSNNTFVLFPPSLKKKFCKLSSSQAKCKYALSWVASISSFVGELSYKPSSPYTKYSERVFYQTFCLLFLPSLQKSLR